jgi:hypothetical protein
MSKEQIDNEIERSGECGDVEKGDRAVDTKGELK